MVSPSLSFLVCIACVGSRTPPSLSLTAPEVTETEIQAPFPGAGLWSHFCPFCRSQAGVRWGWWGRWQEPGWSSLCWICSPGSSQALVPALAHGFTNLPETSWKHTIRKLRCEVTCEEDKWGWTCFRERFLAAMDNLTGLTLQGFSPCLFFDPLWTGHFRGLLFVFELSKDHESTEQNRHKIKSRAFV